MAKKEDASPTDLGLLNEDELSALKKLHNLTDKELTHVKVYDHRKNQMVHSYYKPPGKSVASLSLSLYHQNKIIEAGEVLLVNNFIGGEESVKTDERYTLPVAHQLISQQSIMLKGFLEEL